MSSRESKRKSNNKSRTETEAETNRGFSGGQNASNLRVLYTVRERATATMRDMRMLILVVMNGFAPSGCAHW